jgi:hypothetical protein
MRPQRFTVYPWRFRFPDSDVSAFPVQVPNMTDSIYDYLTNNGWNAISQSDFITLGFDVAVELGISGEKWLASPFDPSGPPVITLMPPGPNTPDE